MRKDFRLLYLCMLAVVTVGCGTDLALKKAEKYYALGEYYDAAAQYKKAYSQTPVKEKTQRGQIAAKLAECYRKTNNTSRAITAYNNVIRNRQTDSLTHLRLAQQLMKNGSYKEAAKHFQAALDSLSGESNSKEIDSKEKNSKKDNSKKKNSKIKNSKEKRRKGEEKTPDLQNSLEEKESLDKKQNSKENNSKKSNSKEKRRKGEEKTPNLQNSLEEKESLDKKQNIKENNSKKSNSKEKRKKGEEKTPNLQNSLEEKESLDEKEFLDKKKSLEQKIAIDKNNALNKKQISSLARNGLTAAKMVPEWKKEGSAYTVKRMDIFNSRRDDYSPTLAGDDNDQLFFTSTRNQAQGDDLNGITGSKAADIFLSQKDDKGKWGKPQSIDSELNSAFDEGACTFSPDGRTMYLTQCKTDPNYPRYANIVISNRSDAAWSKPKELVIAKDTLSSYAHPAISPDGEWLYFVSDMPGGLGGLDIWRCRLYANDETGGVENLGEPINTAGDEMFPTFRPNGDLYFSSDGHPGFGGLDIFIAHPNDYPANTNPTSRSNQHSSSHTPHSSYIIEHPGVPLNSQGDDFGMTFEGLLNKGFFSSNRGDTRGWDHIYSFYNPEIVQTVKGWVYEQDGYELTAAQVYMVGNDGTNLKLNVKGDGSFTQEIKPGVDYVFLGTCKGFLNHQQQLRVQPVTESEEYVLQFPLANISAPVLIENIFYDFDRATLRPESATALDELVKLLNDNPHITIELRAHTDYKGSDQYNERLSQRRAESVVNYLIAHGIAADRLTPKGYGEGKPKTIKRKVAEKYPFLKEGDVLTEDYIAKLSEEQQEQCNQLNRRTEFIVLRTTYGMFDTEGKLLQKPQPEEPAQDSDEHQPSESW